jgi:hypothetical protein
MPNEVDVRVKAHTDDAEKRISSFSSKSSKGFKDYHARALVAATAVGAAVAVGKKWVQQAEEDEVSQARLATGLKNSTGATKAQIAAQEAYITKLEYADGVTDEKLRPALQRLVGATHSVGKGHNLMKRALDASAGSTKSLDVVTTALVKAQNGNVGALAKLGVKTKDADGKTISYREGLKRLSDMYGGQAAAKANTFAGKMDRLKIVLSEAAESIGAALIPVLSMLATFFISKVVPAVTSANKIFQEHKKTILIIAGVIVTFAAAVIAINKAVKAYKAIVAAATAVQAVFNAVMDANPVMLVVLAIAALAVGVVIAYKKSATFRGIVKALWDAMKTFGGWVKSAFIGIIHGIKDVFQAVGDFIQRWIAKLQIWGANIALALISPFTHLPGRLGAPFRAAYDKVAAFKDRAQNKLDQLKADVKTRDFNARLASVRGQLASLHSRTVNVWVQTHGVTQVLNSLQRVHDMASGLDYFGYKAHASGGIAGGASMVGERGAELINLPQGSHVWSNADTRSMRGGKNAPVVLEIRSSGSKLDDLLVELLRKAVRVRGGNVQTVMGT